MGKVLNKGHLCALVCCFFFLLVGPCLTSPCVVSRPGKCWTDLDGTKSLILNRIIMDFIFFLTIKSKLRSTSFGATEREEAKHSLDFTVSASPGFCLAVVLLKYHVRF